MEEANADNTLDKYLSGELSDAEKEAFEKRLDMDESLQKEFEIALKAKAALYAKGIQEQKEFFAQRWEDQKNEANPRRVRPIFYIGLAAAAILLLLLMVFWPFSPGLSNQQLALAFYEAPLALSIRGEVGNQLFKEGNIAFQQKQYDKALTAYLGSLEDSSFTQRDDALFYAGAAYMEKKEYERALDLFEEIEREDYREMKEWYSALSFLFLENRERSISFLEEIAKTPAHYYRQKALDLLDDLK